MCFELMILTGAIGGAGGTAVERQGVSWLKRMAKREDATKRILLTLLTLGFALAFAASAKAQTNDPLPSWNEGASKQTITQFVKDVSTAGLSQFVPPAQRIAVFDNDGTLWSEQPMYFQLAFVLDRVKVLAPMHPEWKDKQPFKAVLEGDIDAALAGGEHALLEPVMATHAGNTTEEFSWRVEEWLVTAQQSSPSPSSLRM